MSGQYFLRQGVAVYCCPLVHVIRPWQKVAWWCCDWYLPQVPLKKQKWLADFALGTLNDAIQTQHLQGKLWINRHLMLCLRAKLKVTKFGNFHKELSYGNCDTKELRYNESSSILLNPIKIVTLFRIKDSYKPTRETKQDPPLSLQTLPSLSYAFSSTDFPLPFLPSASDSPPFPF